VVAAYKLGMRADPGCRPLFFTTEGGDYMALPPNNPLICRVAMIFSRDTRQLVNTFHVVDATGWNLAKMGNLATLFSNWWNTYYKIYAFSGVALTNIFVRLYDPSNPLAYDLNLTTPVPGTAAGPADPADVTLSSSWRTGLAGRKYRGRFYTVGMVNSQHDVLDKVTSPYLTGISTAAANLITLLAAASQALAVWHRISNTYTTINSTIGENLIDAQRRRLPGRGR